MKKSLLALFLVMAIGLNLAGCSVGGDNSGLGDSGAASSGTGESSGTASSKPEEQKKKLNLDVLSDLGLTFEQIREKRGELTEVTPIPGGIGYVFGKGYGTYGWGFDSINWGREILDGEGYPKIPMDENGKFILNEAPLPEKEIECKYLGNVKAKDLLLGLTQPTRASEIEEIYGLKLKGIVEIGVSFEYDKFGIGIDALGDDIIDPEAYLLIKLND